MPKEPAGGEAATQSLDKLLELGERLIADGDVPGAVSHFEKVVASHPQSPAARNNLGVAYWHDGRIPDALPQLVSAIETDQDYREGYLNLVTILLALDRKQEATDIANVYLSRHPEDSGLRNLLPSTPSVLARRYREPGREGSMQGNGAGPVQCNRGPGTGRIRVAVFAAHPKEARSVQRRLLGPLGVLEEELEVLWMRPSDSDPAESAAHVIAACDLIVVQGAFPDLETRPLCAQIVQSGKPVVYDLGEECLGISEGVLGDPSVEPSIPYMREFLAYADRVTVPDRQLAALVAPYNEAVSVVPDGLDPRLWGPDRAARPTGKSGDVVTIGYVGVPGQAEGLNGVETALVRVLDHFDGRVILRCYGERPATLAGHRYVEPGDCPSDYAGYAHTLLNSGIDIAIAPFAGTASNRWDSDARWLEYSACGFAGVYSDVPPYNESVQDGHTGLLVENTEEDWFRALERLVTDSALRERLGRGARSQVLERRTLAVVGTSCLSIYREVAAQGRRPDSARVPVSADYERWKHRHRMTEADRAAWVRRSQVCGRQLQVELVVNALESTDAALAQTLRTISNQIYGNLCITVVGRGPRPSTLDGSRAAWLAAEDEAAAVLERTIHGSTAAWIGFVQAGDRLAEEAVAVCMAYLARHRDWRVLYSDEDLITHCGQRCLPRFKPDVNLDLLRSSAYTGNLCLVQKEAALVVEGPAAIVSWSTSDLVLKVLERFGEQAVGHVPHVLYHVDIGRGSTPANAVHSQEYRRAVEAHLARQGVDATVEQGPIDGTCAVGYRVAGHPSVSIIVPTRDRADMLKNCVESVLTKTDYPNFELVVVDNDSKDAAALEYLRTLEERDRRVRVMRYPHPFNYAAINNAAADSAAGEYLVFLNNDTLVLQPDWLERLVAQGQRPDVGIVGVRLLHMDQTLQHTGLVAGMNATADSVGQGMELAAPGYMGRGQLDQDVSAVTAACMLIRKQRFLQVGGMDEDRFKVRFNDVDLCLKVGQAGYRVVWTPRVSLIHHGRVSVGDAPRAGQEKAVEGLLRQWMPQLAADPAYNRNLSLSSKGWALETEVDVPWDATFDDTPRALGLGAGSYGVLQHRMRAPLDALAEAGLMETATVPVYADRIRVPSAVELERIRPGTLLAHNAVHDEQLRALRDYRQFTDTFLVFGQDDLMFELPRSNPFHRTVFKDIKRRLRTALSACHRLVVTTEALAQAYRHYADDIVIVPNYLPRAVWGQLRSRRRRGAKPRVGWAGALQHGGDLQILRKVIEATAEEVDWVFFGMSLQEFREHCRELHAPVAFEAYPRTLARLDLDLAVAPLEHNRFNEAKSNLRLLEYGALGWPVVCTDIEPYRGAPVCRVRNDSRAWISAIRERIHDLDAAAREGDTLRQWVHDRWMLEDHLQEWLSALSPSANAVASDRPLREADISQTG